MTFQAAISKLVLACAAAAASASVTSPVAIASAEQSTTPISPASVASQRASSGHAIKKDHERESRRDASSADEAPTLLATLVQTHTDERVPLDSASPSVARFSDLLADRVTGSRTALDARLLDLLRALAAKHPGARFELVSGYRSPKLNEQLRKKGHHVASHSQHSLGHACDFRIVPAGETRGIAPRVLEKEIRALGWNGGTGVYLAASDWFVHADVGPKRNWVN